MKTTITTLIILMTMTFAANAQSASDQLYMQLEGAEGVTILSLSKDIIDVVDLVVDDEDSKEVTGPMKKIKMMVCQKESGKVMNDVIKTFEKNPFKEVEEKDPDDDGRIFVIRNGRKVKECHIVADGDDALIVFSFYGDFRVEDIDNLAEKAEDMK